MYGPIGAGPGPTTTYQVDLPLPWGKDTEVTLPMDALVNDAWTSLEPNLNASIVRGATIIAFAVAATLGIAVYVMKKSR